MNASIVTCDPKILGGKPTIAGTRITVELILEKMGAGETIEDVLEAHLQRGVLQVWIRPFGRHRERSVQDPARLHQEATVHRMA